MSDPLPNLRPLNYKRQGQPARGRVIDAVLPAKHVSSPAQPNGSNTSARAQANDSSARSRQPQPISAPAAATWQTPRAVVAAQAPSSRSKRWLQRLQPFVIIFGAMGLGFAAQSPIIGEIIVLLYAAYAIIRKQPSRTTFLLAFLLSVCIMALLIIKSNNTMAATLAIYLFLLLIVGTLQLGLELRKTT